MDLWLKEVAPSAELRKWFGHDPKKWGEFQRRYRAELDSNEEAVQTLKQAIGKGPATLVYGAHDEQHNQAVALRDWLTASKRSRRTSAPDASSRNFGHHRSSHGISAAFARYPAKRRARRS